MITERLMANGDFSLKYTADAGNWLPDRVVGFGTIVVTNARVNLTNVSWSTLVKNALYVGVVDTVDLKTRSIGGQGVACLLGDSERGPQISTAITKTAANLDTWLTDIIPGGAPSNGITKGAVTSPATTVTDSLQYITRRAAMEKICTAVGAEWKVVPNTSTGAIEVQAGTAANLFADYTSPRTIVVAGGATRDAGIRSGRAIDISNTVDVEDYVTSVTAIGRGDGGAEVQVSTGPTVFYGPFGHALDMSVVIDAPEVKRGQTAAFAASELAKRSSLKNTTKLSTDTYNLPADVRPGDRIAIYDPDRGLYDSANSFLYAGRQYAPLFARVVGWQWPVREGMGVYYRLPQNSDVILDLSEVIEAENGPASAEIGAWSRSILWTPGDATGSPVVTGDMPKAISTDPWTPVTPILTNVSLGTGGKVVGKWKREGTKVTFKGLINFGTGGAPSGVVYVGLPIQAADGADDWAIGTASATDFSSSFIRTVGIAEVTPAVWGQVVHFSSTGNANWDASAPFPFANGDSIYWNVTYESKTS